MKNTTVQVTDPVNYEIEIEDYKEQLLRDLIDRCPNGGWINIEVIDPITSDLVAHRTLLVKHDPHLPK